ncbi:troponin C [Folsomia candida]|uniref:troponin C n=1 Tax=Folsomia candida TaxID=158441 RepID=UPI000B8EE902|nr:troponin C [Folsomia candida]
MEFKVRKESQTLLEKIFNNHERRGVVRGYQMPTLLRSLNPELNYNETELKELVDDEDTNGSGLDFDAFSRISLHFLLKQVRRESNDFSHKKLVRPGDFPEAT